MKKYTKPSMEIVALQSAQNIAADTNPITATTNSTTGVVTTVYNLALMANGSLKSAPPASN